MFVGKLTVTTAAFDGGLAWLAALVLLNTVLSLFYYLRWIAPAFSRSDEPAEASHPPADDGRSARTAAYTAALISLVVGVAAGPLLAALAPWTPA